MKRQGTTLMSRITIAVTLSLFPISLSAQWLDFKTPGIPRTPDGKPDLMAPAPRTAEGKPDLSGLWEPGPNGIWLGVIQNVKEQDTLKPAAQAIWRKRAAEYNRDGPYTRCLPLGPIDIFATVSRIIQLPTEVVLLRSGPAGDDYRRIFMDGRALSKDLNPTWRGYSVGRWDADTLVVETTGFNDVGMLDQVGHPRSEKLHVTERFQRTDFGHMQLQITLDDTEILAKPLTLSLRLNYLADTDTSESVCNENELDRTHFVATNPKAKIKLSTAALAKYAGT
jgi:hypothetical protein